MSRYDSEPAHGFNCRKIDEDIYCISWTVNFYYPSSQLRYPRTFRRNTDKQGAIRFCKKHGLNLNL